jgi:hypothetical protein
MGDKDILFLRNHGVIVSGPTSPVQTCDDLYYLERAAMGRRVLAMQTGRPLHNIDDAMAEHTARQIAGEAQQAFLHFESLKRMLDRRTRLEQARGGLGYFRGQDAIAATLVALSTLGLVDPVMATGLRRRRDGAEARRTRSQGLSEDPQDQGGGTAHLGHHPPASCAAR